MLKSIFKAVFAIVFVSAFASGQTTTTYTGVIKDLSQNVVAAGQVTFELRPSLDATISGFARFVPSTITCSINQATAGASSAARAANSVTISGLTGHTFVTNDIVTVSGMTDSSFNGTFTVGSTTATSITYPQTAGNTTTGSGVISALRSTPGPGSCTVTMNTALNPSGTSYRICIQPNYISPGSCFNDYAVVSSRDITTVIPTPTTSPAYTFVDLHSAQTVDGNKTFTGSTSFTGSLTMGALTATGITDSGNATVGGTLGVTGAATLSSTLGVTGTSTLANVNLGASNTLGTSTVKQVSATTALTIQDNLGVSHLFISGTSPFTNTFFQGNGAGATFIGTGANAINIPDANNIINFPGATSGTIALKATAVAGSNTLTLPAATDTLIGKATTDTLTNKTLTSPVITSPTINTGVANNGTGFQHKRGVTGCATAASLNAVCSTTITWNSAFADANYTVIGCVGNGVASGIPVLNAIGSKIAASITVQTLAITAAAAQYSTIECTAVHD
jgi:hypothetical protein